MPLRDVQPWTWLALALLLLVEAVSHSEASLALTFYLIELLHSAACLLLSTSSLWDANQRRSPFTYPPSQSNSDSLMAERFC